MTTNFEASEGEAQKDVMSEGQGTEYAGRPNVAEAQKKTDEARAALSAARQSLDQAEARIVEARGDVGADLAALEIAVKEARADVLAAQRVEVLAQVDEARARHSDENKLAMSRGTSIEVGKQIGEIDGLHELHRSLGESERALRSEIVMANLGRIGGELRGNAQQDEMPRADSAAGGR